MLWLQEFGTTALEIKNVVAVVVVLLIFLKHNGLSQPAGSNT